MKTITAFLGFLLLIATVRLANASTLNVRVAPYSAVGDGVADDTIAIQAALTDASTAGGGVVFIPGGIYKISNPLVIYSKTRVLGEGRGITIIRSSPGGPIATVVNGAYIFGDLCMVAADRSSVESLTVDLRTYGTTTNGIEIVPDGPTFSGTPCTNCTVRDCEVIGFNAHEYLIWNVAGRGIKILNNFIDGGVLDPATNLGQEGIESYGGTDVLIQGNTLTNVGGGSINIGSTSEIPNTQCSGIIVMGNTITTSTTGVNIGTETVGSYGPQNLLHIHCKNNVITNSITGIQVYTGFQATLDDVQLIGNSIVNPKVGIYFNTWPPITSTGNIVSNNVIENPAGSSYSFGIYGVATHNILFSGNIIRNGSFEGIRLVNSNNCTLVGNVIESFQTKAIYALNGTNLLLSSNILRNYNLASGPNPALLLIGIKKGRIAGNVFDSSSIGGTVAIDSTSDQIIVSDNSAPPPYTPGAPSPDGATYGTNANRGAVSAPAGKTSFSVSNTLVTRGCPMLVVQESGNPVAFTVSTQLAGFTVTLAAKATGNEIFRYEIRK